jgi:Cof subfamily protein (haloacid dehalogenase superfamily)
MSAPFKLIATDVDGTLIAGGAESPSARTGAALRAARAAGLIVVLVTGRPPRGVWDLARRRVADLAICANGALVYDLPLDRLTLERPLPEAVTHRLVTDLRAAAPGVVFAAEAGFQFCREPGYLTAHPLDSLNPVVEDALGFGELAVAKLIARHDGMQQKLLIALAEAVAGADAVVTRSGPELVEIAAAGVTKASTLEAVCAERGIAASEVLAFGDMVNDVSLLRWAGHGVAVAGAHPDLLAVADEVTASAEDDGVAVYLERLSPPGPATGPP